MQRRRLRRSRKVSRLVAKWCFVSREMQSFGKWLASKKETRKDVVEARWDGCMVGINREEKKMKQELRIITNTEGMLEAEMKCDGKHGHKTMLGTKRGCQDLRKELW